MNDPRVAAVLSGLCTVYFGYAIFGPSSEAPSTLLSTLYWFFFIVGLIGLLGSIVKLARGQQD